MDALRRKRELIQQAYVNAERGNAIEAESSLRLATDKQIEFLNYSINRAREECKSFYLPKLEAAIAAKNEAEAQFADLERTCRRDTQERTLAEKVQRDLQTCQTRFVQLEADYKRVQRELDETRASRTDQARARQNLEALNAEIGKDLAACEYKLQINQRERAANLTLQTTQAARITELEQTVQERENEIDETNKLLEKQTNDINKQLEALADEKQEMETAAERDREDAGKEITYWKERYRALKEETEKEKEEKEAKGEEEPEREREGEGEIEAIRRAQSLTTERKSDNAALALARGIGRILLDPKATVDMIDVNHLPKASSVCTSTQLLRTCFPAAEQVWSATNLSSFDVVPSMDTKDATVADFRSGLQALKKDLRSTGEFSPPLRTYAPALGTLRVIEGLLQNAGARVGIGEEIVAKPPEKLELLQQRRIGASREDQIALDQAERLTHDTPTDTPRIRLARALGRLVLGKRGTISVKDIQNLGGPTGRACRDTDLLIGCFPQLLFLQSSTIDPSFKSFRDRYAICESTIDSFRTDIQRVRLNLRDLRPSENLHFMENLLASATTSY